MINDLLTRPSVATPDDGDYVHLYRQTDGITADKKILWSDVLLDIENEFALTVIGNYVIVDSVDDLPTPSGGEHLLDPGVTYEFVDNDITGLPPTLTNALRVQDGANVNFRAPLTLNPLVYIGAGAFIRSDAVEIYVQTSIAIATPFGSLYDVSGNSLSSVFFVSEFAFIGVNAGVVKNFIQFGMDSMNFLDWQTGLSIQDCTVVTTNNISGPPVVGGSGPLMSISGEGTSQIRILQGNAFISSGQSFLFFSPDISDFGTIDVRNNGHNSAVGGDFFEPGLSGSIISAADNSETGSILSFADNGSGGTTVTATAPLPAAIVNGRKITQSATTNYNGTFSIFNVSASAYDINTPFVGDDATGTWDFNSVTFTTSVAHALSNGTAVQIDKSYVAYRVGRNIFDASGSVFSMDDVIFQSPGGALTGIWTTSLKQDDSRMSCTGNGDQPDTAQLLTADITSQEIVIINNADEPTDITSWTAQKNRQFTLNAPDEDTGSFRYDGKAITGALIAEFTGQMASGSGEEIKFSLFRKPDGGGYSLVGNKVTTQFTNKDETVTLFFAGVDVSPFDVFKLRVEVVGINTNVAINSASLFMEKTADGF